MGLKRLLAAAAVLPFLILFVMKLPAYCYAGLLVAVSALAQMEFYAMFRVRGVLKVAGMLLGALIIGSIYFEGDFLWVLALSFIVITSIRLFAVREPESSLGDTAPVLFGLLYIPLLLSYQMDLRGEGPEWIIFLYGAVWCADGAAYYIGKGLGRRKLYASVSPNKTVAGAVGSVLGGALGAAVFRAILIPSLPLEVTLAVGAMTGGVTIIGDLVESMLKRDANVKDSGSLVPGGHGGVLDKIDGAVFAGPAMYWMLRAMGTF